MARLIYHQGLFGYSNFENITRTFGVLVDHDPEVRGLPSPHQWENALGVSLPAYVAIMFHLAAAANAGSGWVTIDDIQVGVNAGAFAGADLDTVLKIIRRDLSADVHTHRALGKQQQLAGAEMWSFNPLMAKPLVSRGDRFLLPVHDYLIQKMTSLGLYFTGIAHFGDDSPGLWATHSRSTSADTSPCWRLRAPRCTQKSRTAKTRRRPLTTLSCSRR
ncbi:hypothetical protein GS463_03110 [Rhodococcus hoagii]|nr:hypothetical protein [Prescottella equi]